MITYVKESKLDKVNPNFFAVVKVSMEKANDNELAIPYIIPPASIMIPRVQGNIGKKKFLKKYKNYLKNSKAAELSIFNIAQALKQKTSICFTCTDKEFKLGYIQALSEYIASVFGFEVYDLNDCNEMLNSELKTLDKNQRKLIKKSESNVSGKKAKIRKKLIKNINKSIRSQFSEEGEDYYNELDKELAVDQIIFQSLNEGICSYDKKGAISNIDESKIKDSRPYVTAILLTSEKKPYKKIVKSVLDSNGVDLKKKTLKKLSKKQVVLLCVQIARKLNEYRENELSDKGN